MIVNSSYDKFKYTLYIPGGDNLPLIVVLHGSGEIGSDLSKLKKREPYIALSKGTCTPNAMVLMPQLPKGSWGDYKSSLKDLIDHVAADQGCDMKRVSITGHSLGANGTLDMLLAYPDFFSAASVLSPCKDIGDKMKQIAHVPIWFLAGEKEHNYKKYAQSMYNRLKGLGGETKLTLVPGYGHPIQFTWVSDKYGMFEWLASYRLDRFIVDVSKHQGHIDWNRLAPHLAFCIIKASGLYGNGSDPYYERNMNEAVAHGIPFHAYHFLYCVTEVQAKRDAKLFFDTVKAGGKWPLFWVMDCESQWGIADNHAAPIGRIFEDELRRLAREHGPGDIRVAIYVGQEKYKYWAFDYDHFAYVWIPGYGEKWKPLMPCDMWQYTDKGKLPGINGDVDMNKLMGTKPLEFFTTEADDSVEQDGDSTTDDKDGGEALMFTGKELVAYCEEMYANKSHWAYWYGTYGNMCTEAKYKSKKKQYPEHYGSSRTAGYMKDIELKRRCADCVGMIKSFFWTGNHYDTDPKYGTNGCPDKSANGLFDMCKVKGNIKDIPDIPGIVVWKDGHIGVYIGGGYTIEMRGFDYDCVKRKVKDGPWKKWGKLPMLSYDDTPVPEPSKLGDRDLKRGCEGDDVKELQADLMKLGYAIPKFGADGDYGSETERAVKQFQLAYGLPDDGVMNVGADYDTLFKALDGDKPQEYGHVEITGGSVNIRSAPGYDSKVYGTAHKGDILPYQGVTQEAEGKPWYLIIWENQNAWVSSKYAKLVN